MARSAASLNLFPASFDDSVDAVEADPDTVVLEISRLEWMEGLGCGWIFGESVRSTGLPLLSCDTVEMQERH